MQPNTLHPGWAIRLKTKNEVNEDPATKPQNVTSNTCHEVLYADDDPDDQLFLSEMLQHHLPQVKLHGFCDGQRLLNFLQHRPPHTALPTLILLDINMPLLNGKETLVRLRMLAEYATVPVVFLTTSSSYNDRSFAQQHKAGFLVKPVYDTQFNAVVDYVKRYCVPDHEVN